jgi:hypothetical protein
MEGRCLLATATHLSFIAGQPPASMIAGQTFGVTVEALDAAGLVDTSYNGTISLSQHAGSGSLQLPTSSMTASQGVATFPGTMYYTVVSTGNTIQATSGALTSATSSATAVTPAAASTLTVAGFPSPMTAGDAHRLTVTALDAYGNTATDFTGTIRFTSTSAGTLPPNYTFVSGDNGTHNVNGVILTTAGTQSITATDTVTGSISGSQTGIVVNPAAASAFTVSGFPSLTTAGAAHGLTVTALDAYGNTVTGYAGTVRFTSTSAGTLPANYKFVSGNNGTHDFAGVILTTAGTQSITATAGGGVTGSQSGIVVNPAAASALKVMGFSSPTTAGAAHSLTVTAQDAYGNTATGYTGTVHFTTSSTLASLPSNYTFTMGTGLDNGTHTFTGVALDTVGTQSITATDTVVTSITGSQTGIAVNPAGASTLSVSGFTSPTVAGTTHSMTVTAYDPYNNVATGYTGTVHFTTSSTLANLPSNYTFSGADAGTNTFAGVALNTAGTQSITATDTVSGSITGSQTGILVNPTSASALAVTGFASPTTAGASNSLTVTARDVYGNTARGYTGTVHFTTTSTLASLPGNYAFLAGDSGTHTFSGVSLRTSGTQSITATDTITGTITGSQPGITVNPATASTLTVAGFSSPTAAGATHSLTVTAKDAYGNTATGYMGTVHFTSTSTLASLPSDYTFLGGDAGSHTFTNVSLNTASTQSITATDTVTSSITGSQTGITVNPASASALTVMGFSSPTTAGVAHSLTVTAQDAYGNTATGYAGTVHFTTSSTLASLPTDYTFVVGDAGIHTFIGVALNTAGTQSITATDTGTSSITGTQTGITVNPASAIMLAVTGFPSPTTAGATNSLTVTAKDAYGNTASGYTGTVHFTSTSTLASLPANYAFGGGDAGAHTFAGVALNTAGTQSITATDTVTGSITGSQAGITVNPATASTLTVAGFASPTTAGATQSLTVTAKDAYGNTATGYTGTVQFTTTSALASLPSDYTFTLGELGTHTFSGVSLKTVGTQSITATDSLTGSIAGSQTGIAINPASASTLGVGGFPSPTSAGATHSLTVTAYDPYHNVATGYSGTVHFTSTSALVNPPSDYTFTGSDSGSHTFTGVALGTVGTQSITATDTVTLSITGTQTGITVDPASASTLVVTGFPSPTTAGSPQPLTVTAYDPYGNVATGYAGTVHFTTTSSLSSLPVDYTFVGGDAGTHTFAGVALNTVGTQSITATDAATGTIMGSQNGITVNTAAVQSFTLSGYPTPTTAGVGHNLAVTAYDAFGNVATGYDGTVHFTSTSALADLPADYTFVGGDAGTHTFSGVALNSVGTQSITATDTVTTGIQGSTGSITVNPASASTLGVTDFPSPTIAGATYSLSVTAYDPFGNVATGYRGTVRFTSTSTLASLPEDYTFGGGDAGAHTFSGVALNTAGTQSITATDTVTSSITGSQTGIIVNPTSSITLDVTGFLSPTTAGVTQSLTVTAKDSFGNVDTGYAGTVHFTSTSALANLPADYTFDPGDAGTHLFNGVALNTVGTQSITATDTVTGGTSGSQTGILVNPASASQLAVSGFPSSTTAGIGQSLTVTAEDPYGNKATGYAGTVRFTTTSALSTLPSDYTFVVGDAGSHIFAGVELDTVGTQSITATDTGTGSINGSQTSITVNPAEASTLTVAGLPSPTTAGAGHNLTVTAFDPFGNTATGYHGTVHFTSTSALADLPSDYTFEGGDAGTHTFTGVSLNTVGTQSVTVTDTVATILTGSQTGITVNPASVSLLAVTGFPTPTTAGVGQTLTVTAQDIYGNTVPSYAGTVHFTTTSSRASLPEDYTFVGGDAGSHTFTGVALNTVGTQTIRARDTVSSSITGTQSGIAVNPAAASTLAVTGFPSPTTAGATHDLTVTAKDPYGNVATSYTGTVHFTTTSTFAILPSDYTFESSDAGSRLFLDIALNSAGTQSITVTDTVTSTIHGSQTSITVNAGVVRDFVLSGFPSPTVAGAPHSITVTAEDDFRNVVTSYTGTVHFTSTSTLADLPGDYTFVGGDAGTHTFSGVALNTVGTQSITATDTVTSTLHGSQTGIAVDSAPASSLTVIGFPSPTTAGAAQSLTVTAYDPYGNLATGYAGTVNFTTTSTLSNLPADYTFVVGDAGNHVFTGVALNTAGTQSITATDTATGSVTGSQTGITVDPAVASVLGVTGFPSSTTAGATHDLTVTAYDVFGNVATGYGGTVHLTTSSALASLPSDYTFGGGDAGTHTFAGVGLDSAGTQSVTATDTAASSIAGSQTGITVNSAAASRLIVAAFPSPSTAGDAHSVVVTAKDAYGNTVTSYTGTVQFHSSDSKAVLPADYTFSGANGGSHIFDATLETAGAQRIDVSDSTIFGAQTGITVNPAAASALTVAGFPSPTTAGTPHSLSVTAYDAFGNIATGYTGTVTFTSSDMQAILPVNYNFQASDLGGHTFSGLALGTAGTQSISAADTVSGMTGLQTGITVNPAAVSTFEVHGFATPTAAGASQGFTVTAKDPYNNTVTNYSGTVGFTSTDNQATLPANYAFQPSDDGTHPFSVTFRTAGDQALRVRDVVNESIFNRVSGIIITPATAQSLTISGLPNPVTAGVATMFTVTARDGYGNIATGYNGTVHITTSDAKATLPPDHTFSSSNAGVYTFTTLVLGTGGRQTVTASGMIGPAVTPSTVATWVNPGAMASLATYMPAIVTAGAAQSFNVRALDAYGNTATGYTGTVQVTSTDSRAVLPPNYTFGPSDAGYHTFPVTLETAGSTQVKATDVGTGINGTSNTTVQAAAASTMTVSGFPSPITAGVYAHFLVSALDVFGNVATGYRGTVHVATTSTLAELPADYTFTSSDAGSHTFSGRLNTAGSQSIQAVDTHTPSIMGLQSGIVVNPSAASTFSLNYPMSTIAGTSQPFSVTALDVYGNTVTAYTGTVHFTSDDTKAVLPADYAYQASDAGTHAFAATLKTAGTKAIRASDVARPALTGLQSGIAVSPAAAQMLTMTGLPNPVTAGASNSFTVTARDPYGNVATSYAGTVRIASSDSQATLPANYTFNGSDAGVHTFNGLVLRTAGAQTVAASDLASSSLVTSARTFVNPSTAGTLGVTGFPSATAAGLSNRFTVSALDAFGNVATGYTGTVHFTSTSALASLPANYTFLASDSGDHAFTASLNSVGSQAISATDMATSSIAGSQSGIVVSPGPVSTFAPLNFPITTTAGVAQPVLVRALDAYGNTVTSYSGTVHFTSSDSHAVLPPDYTFQPSDTGVHAFVVTLVTAGTQALRVTDTANSSITSLQTGISVAPAAAQSLAITGLPNPVTAGVGAGFVVTVKDAYGNTATGYAGTVHFTSSDANASLPGNYTFGPSDAGSHTFSAVFGTVGTQSLTADDVATPSIVSTARTWVNPGEMASLSVYMPSTTTAGAAQTFSVKALDAYGNTATGYTGTVQVTSSDPAAVLPANYTYGPSDAGLHTFSVTLNTPGYPSVTATDVASGIHASTTTHVISSVGHLAVIGTGSTQSATGAGSGSDTPTQPVTNPSSGQQPGLHGRHARLRHAVPHPHGPRHRRVPRHGIRAR